MSFSSFQWATEFSNRMSAIHEAECLKRKSFNELFEGHYLNIIFPGLRDMPPKFALKPPAQFDANLPTLNRVDALELFDHINALMGGEMTAPDFGEAVNELFPIRLGASSDGQAIRTQSTTIALTGTITTTTTTTSGGVMNKVLDMLSHLKEYER